MRHFGNGAIVLQATWFKGDKELKPGGKYDMKVTPKHAILTVKKASKRDDGQYRVVMQNNLGKDDADVKAKVKGMRTRPLKCVINLPELEIELSLR